MSKHHCINSSTGGSNHKDNITGLDHHRIHEPIHKLFKNYLPHIILLLVIKRIGKPLQDQVKDKLIEILTRDPESLYKPHCIGNRNKFRKAIKDSKKIINLIDNK